MIDFIIRVILFFAIVFLMIILTPFLISLLFISGLIALISLIIDLLYK